MAATDNLLDLDFTKFVPLAKAPDEGDVRPETQIGDYAPGMAGNLVFYTRPGKPHAAASDAPVLVVEDDEVTRRVLVRVLTARGLPVRTASDSKELQQILRLPPLPRLILLDVGLPRISGFRILGLLRQHPQTSAIPIIMVTASSENKDIAQGLALGADGYLSKPLTVATLHSAIDRILRRPA
jgi:CheY-like chemotaxis protein